MEKQIIMIGFIKFIVTLLIGYMIREIQNKYRGEIVYLCRNERLVVPQGLPNQDVQILYKQQPIERLSVAKIMIINNSNYAIKKADLVKGGLFIKGRENTHILRIDSQNNTNTGNIYKLLISDDQQNTEIKFHYFNPGDTWLFQVFHTGKDKEDLICCCFAAGITHTKKIILSGRSSYNIIISTILQMFFCLVLLLASIDLFVAGGWRAMVSILLVFLIVLSIYSWVLSLDLNYRFKSWYKTAIENRF